MRAFGQEGRQDEQHLKTSPVTATRFIIQLLREAKIKLVLWNVERLIAASQNKPYQRLEKKHRFKVLSAIPIQQIRERATNDLLVEEEDRKTPAEFSKGVWPQVEGRPSYAIRAISVETTKSTPSGRIKKAVGR